MRKAAGEAMETPSEKMRFEEEIIDEELFSARARTENISSNVLIVGDLSPGERSVLDRIVALAFVLSNLALAFLVLALRVEPGRADDLGGCSRESAGGFVARPFQGLVMARHRQFPSFNGSSPASRLQPIVRPWVPFALQFQRSP
jgi:hypothetical protein